ncbi:MAG TPA: creatininase family protein [Pseudonocardiaceae bacterium]|jgi:creatinine amidohydrolase|nr:creatininase family protein [Pseudonocardiaceae bacterium]
MLTTAATSTDEAKRDARVAMLPVGSFEQHGDHLPLTTDTLIACIIASRLAATYDVLLLPPVTVSCSHEHEGFSGTVSISSRTLIAIIDDIRSSLARSGIKYLVLVNGHGGNYVLSNITQEANVTERRVALFPGREDFRIARECAEMETNTSEDMHGGEWETSILLHAHPHLVRSTYSLSDHDAPHRPHFLMTGMRAYPRGIIGRPSVSNAAKGQAALDSLVSSFSDVLKVLTG